MRNLFLCGILSAVAYSVALVTEAAEETNPFARDILILTNWFEGEFDNEEQLWFENDPRSATPEDERHIRLHTIHKRLNLPEFGDHVFYVEEYRDNDPSNIVRQRFVTFEPDLAAGVIRMQQGFFKDSKAFLGTQNDPSKAEKINANQIFFMKDIAPENKCDVFWRRVGDQFEGKMIERGCQLGTDGNGPPRYSVHNMILSQSKYWRVDSSFLVADDSLHVGDPIDRPIQMRRAEIFKCEGSFRTENGSQELTPFKLHNQGGTAKITRALDGQSFDILLRKKEYPFYETRPDFLYFSIRKSGEQRSLLYSVNDIDSRRFGLNHAGIAVHCYRQGYTFQQTLEEL